MWLRINLFFLFVINVFSILNIQAQHTTALKGSISGTIQDTKTAEAIAYGTVAVINAKDSSIAGGAVSDEKGNFKIESFPFGNYFLKFSFIGYQNFKTESFSLTTNQPDKLFGLIKLKPSVTSLKTVTVVGK